MATNHLLPSTMKKSLLSFFTLSIVLISANILLTASSNGRASVGSGNTGAPSEGQTCRNCHGSRFGTTVSISIRDTSGSTVTQYNAGDTLEVKVDINTSSGSPSRYGFQIVSLDSNNNGINSWTSPSSNAKIVAITRTGRTYAEHNGPSTTSSFTSKWVAPASGTGTITFYAGGVAANNNRGTSGDGGNTTSLTLTENVVTSLNKLSQTVEAAVFPNPVYELLNLQFESLPKDVIEVELFDQNGRLVMATSMPPQMTYQLDLNTIDRGIYFMAVSERNKMVYRTKVVKN